jgi:hypothetical protein
MTRLPALLLVIAALLLDVEIPRAATVVGGLNNFDTQHSD